MSSLHQDHLLAEGPEPVTGTATTPGTARGTSRGATEEKATRKVPTQRLGNAKRTGSTSTIGDGSRPSASTSRPARSRTAAAPAAGTLASRAKAAAVTKAAATTKAASAKAATAKAATVKAASAKAATAKTATVKAATAGAASAKVATAKAATAARAAAVSKVSHRAAPRTATAKPAAKATAGPAAKPAAATTSATVAPAVKPAATAKPKPAATAKPKPAATAKPKPAGAAKKAAATPAAAVATVRPTPYKRTPADESAVAVAEVPVVPQPDGVSSEVPASEVVSSIAEGPRSRFLRRRPPSLRRRPSLYLAAALAGAISVSGFSSGDPVAQATDTASHSVSVAQELGVSAHGTDALTDTHAAERLGELAVSRHERGAEQAAAAQTQAAADQAAVEAARPKAILPVTGALLTSTFGPRWGTLHAGIDLAAPMRTPEMAAMDGVVLEAGPASGFGLAVYIQHANGDVTVYGHMDEILVTAGQVVKAGDPIALLGQRGEATGPHLHFEVHVGGINGEKIDPLPWLRERGVAI